MAIQSKYSNEQMEQLLNEILLVLENRKAPVDLSLMALGNAATHIIKHRVAPQHRTELCEQFATALRRSMD